MNRHQVSLIILSIIDVIFGILSIIFSVLAVQIIATLVSGVTLVKAIQIAIQSKKVANLVTPAVKVAFRATPILLLRVLNRVRKNKKKEQETMHIEDAVNEKEPVFTKIKTAIKNNPFTILMVIIETLLGACGGYLGINKLTATNLLEKPVALAVGIIALVIVYAVCIVITVYIGRDNPAFALIRKFVKQIGGDEAVRALDKAVTEIEASKAEAELLAKAEAEKKAFEDEILAKIEAEEKAKAEAEKQAKIAAYKAAHPELFGTPIPAVETATIKSNSNPTIKIV